MTDEELSDRLAAAVADHASIDSQNRIGEADQELVHSLRVISAIGAARRAGIVADHARGARVLLIAGAVIAAISVGLVGIAIVSALSGWSRIPLQEMYAPYFLFTLLFGGAGAVLLVGGTRDRRVQVLGLFFLIIAAAFVRPLMPKGTPDWMLRVYVDAFLALALWQFVWLFPTEPVQPLARRIGRVFLTLSAVAGVTLFVMNLLRGASVAARVPYLESVLQLFDRTAFMLLYWPLLFLIAAPAIPYLLWKSRVETRANQRRVTWFVGSLVVGLLPILFAVLVTPLVPQLSQPEWRDRVGIVLYVALASIVPSTAYAVAVSHVLDLHLVLRRTIQYGLAKTSVWGAILVPLLYLAFDVYLHRELTVRDYLSLGRSLEPLLLLSIGSFTVLTFRHQVLRHVDRWFRRDATDHTESLARLERGLRSARTIRDISSALKREIERAVHPSSVAVLMVDSRRGQLISLESAVPPLRAGSALLDLLRSIRTEVQLSYRADGPVAGLLPPNDRAWLHSTGFGLFSPLLGSPGTLLGVVGIGEGANGLPYTERDCMLITAMSGQAALALENNRLRERTPTMPAEVGDEASPDWENEPAERCPRCCAIWRPPTRHCTCGSTTVEAALPLNVKGKFQVQRFLGAGGTGVVYLAVDLALDRKVAIKTLPPIRLEHASRLHREARAMANVLHPNLALIYGAEQWKGTPLLIFEFLEGGTLLDSLARGAIPLDEVIDLGTLLADALDRVHGSGVLHRDIKPSNIGYTADGVPKLLDFGLAAILDRSRSAGTPPAVLPADLGLVAELAWGADPATSLTITQQLVGTPLYLSPEALAGQGPQPSFDLWSLSLVLYQAYAGRHPLAGESTAELLKTLRRGALPDVRDFKPECPAPFAAFLNDALSPVAARRPQSAADLRTRLRWLHAHLFPHAS